MGIGSTLGVDCLLGSLNSAFIVPLSDGGNGSKAEVFSNGPVNTTAAPLGYILGVFQVSKQYGPFEILCGFTTDYQGIDDRGQPVTMTEEARLTRPVLTVCIDPPLAVVQVALS